MRDYAQAAEGLGFDYLVAPDHVIGVDPAKIPPGQRGSNATAYHDPFVLFGFLAGVTKKIGFAAGVLILAQRQAALVAKQAASLDALCEGRFRLGVGVGWHEIEFQGLGMDFHTRGVRSAEQVRFMQALWAKDGVTFKGKYHELDRRRHQSAAEVRQGAGVVRRPRRADPEARGQVRRRLHAQPLAAGRRGARRSSNGCAA